MVYVVLEIYEEGTEIIGIYDNKESAEKLLEIDKSFTIQEYKLNELTEEGKYYVFSFIKKLKEKLNIKEEN